MKKKTIVIIVIVVVAIIAGVVGVGVYHYKMEKLKVEQKATEDFYRIMEENMSTWPAESNEENEIDEEELESEADTENESNDEISPDVKEFLDSYEAFMDEYVDFMKKYKQNPTDATLIAEYADMMSEYSDFVQAADELKTDLNDAEMKYYTEVMLRIEQKMLEAM